MGKIAVRPSNCCWKKHLTSATSFGVTSFSFLHMQEALYTYRYTVCKGGGAGIWFWAPDRYFFIYSNFVWRLHGAVKWSGGLLVLELH
jgi:hypothetical protein